MNYCKDCFHYKACIGVLEETVDRRFLTDFNPCADQCKDYINVADVALRAEVEELQECIYDLYAMLDGIIYNARNNDLSALRPFRGASGCDAYQGAPPICRKFDKVFDKHEEAISAAVKFAELKKKYTEGENDN